MSDWRESELERIGGTIAEAALRPEDDVVARVGPWFVRWSHDAGVSIARADGFDRWANSRIMQCADVATGDDVARLLEMAE